MKGYKFLKKNATKNFSFANRKRKQRKVNIDSNDENKKRSSKTLWAIVRRLHKNQKLNSILPVYNDSLTNPDNCHEYIF